MAFFSVTVSRRELAAHAADRQTVTPGELREIEGRVDDLGRETGYLGAELAALRENRGELKELSPVIALFAPLTPSVFPRYGRYATDMFYWCSSCFQKGIDSSG